MSQRNYDHNADESERAIEQYLVKLTKEAGGIALKFSSATQTGYPDRLLLFPHSCAVWVELKSRGENPTPLQNYRIMQLREMGYMVRVCDSREKVREAVEHAKKWVGYFPKGCAQIIRYITDSEVEEAPEAE